MVDKAVLALFQHNIHATGTPNSQSQEWVLGGSAGTLPSWNQWLDTEVDAVVTGIMIKPHSEPCVFHCGCFTVGARGQSTESPWLQILLIHRTVWVTAVTHISRIQQKQKEVPEPVLVPQAISANVSVKGSQMPEFELSRSWDSSSATAAGQSTIRVSLPVQPRFSRAKGATISCITAQHCGHLGLGRLSVCDRSRGNRI